MTNLTVVETAYDHHDAVALREAMGAEMGDRYADREGGLFNSPANVIDAGSVHRTILVYADEVPVGHALLRWNGPDIELKRMFVAPDFRGKGVSGALMTACEDAARDLGLARLILQTGDRQPDAVRLYEKSGYTRIPIFSPYEVMPFSICFEKRLRRL